MLARFKARQFWTPAMATGMGLLAVLVLIAVIAPLFLTRRPKS